MLRVAGQGEEGGELVVPFASCLFDVLGLPQDADSHPSVILDQSHLPDGIEDEDNELGLVLRLRLAGEGEVGGVPLGHATDCPARQMQLRQIAAVPSTDVLDRDRFRKPRVQIGVVVLIEAHDHGIAPPPPPLSSQSNNQSIHLS